MNAPQCGKPIPGVYVDPEGKRWGEVCILGSGHEGSCVAHSGRRADADASLGAAVRTVIEGLVRAGL